MREALAAAAPGRVVALPSLQAIRRGAAMLVTVLTAALLIQAPVSPAATSGRVDPGLLRAAAVHPGSELHVIVREATPSSDAAEMLVRRVGGSITHELGIIGGFSASV